MGPPAPVASRLAAYLLDWVVTFILTCVFLSAGGLVLLVSSDMGRVDPPDRALVAALVIASLVIPVWFVMTVVGWTWHGRSVGKLAMNLRIVDRRGEPPGLTRALVRLAVYVLENAPLPALPLVLAASWLARDDMATGLALAGYALLLILPLVSAMMALRDPSGRALHDRVAGTRVLVD